VQKEPHVKTRGFTLIELLIVVAIISILAAIAVPNFLEAQTRSKVSRTKADMRSLSVAVESYILDNNRYPPRSKFPAGLFLGLPDVLERASEMSRFTTPISYVSSLPKDVFENRVAAPNDVIDYWDPIHVEFLRDFKFSIQGFDYGEELNQGGMTSYPFGWALVSVGPDNELGNAQANQGHYPVQSTGPGGGATIKWDIEYDPTNGTISDGNITRFHRNGANADEAFRKQP